MPPLNTDLTALLLAGGRSRRFGTDKARAEVNGRPMLQRVYDVARRFTPHVLLSVRADGDFYFDLVPPAVPRLLDPVPDAGPLAGLVAGLRTARTPWLLALACDLPFLTKEALQPLLEARTADVTAVVPITSDGYRQPLCALYHVAAVRPVAEAQLTAGCYALQTLLDRLRLAILSLPDASLRNVNVPDDLRLGGIGPE
ncbi:molybdenum cofactor guanylyltransferase [Rhodothermus profundi]|uniref:Probable molybdenum cofactor guanylyltransferase n=1 Tax=Rhodothermus profundi TaxID=633813 RepID=A0A1M6ULM0_9BACT|nr:molybdenum cofactor guanylyltransferase [Rhodothermus profundi]SHK70030.1 molybdenum cofactor guanylyltransferase [Rhodothermus profundi]